MSCLSSYLWKLSYVSNAATISGNSRGWQCLISLRRSFQSAPLELLAAGWRASASSLSLLPTDSPAGCNLCHRHYGPTSKSRIVCSLLHLLSSVVNADLSIENTIFHVDNFAKYQSIFPAREFKCFYQFIQIKSLSKHKQLALCIL